MIKLTFDFPPVAQARPRATRFGKGIRLYDPKQVHVYKAQLAESAQFMYHDEPLAGPLVLRATFYRPIQKSISKKEHRRRANGEVMPTMKPDLSNYLKAFEDGLNGILWEDDAQIVEEAIRKAYSDNPRVELEVEEE